jgi:hypothetical protein
MEWRGDGLLGYWGVGIEPDGSRAEALCGKGHLACSGCTVAHVTPSVPIPQYPIPPIRPGTAVFSTL